MTDAPTGQGFTDEQIAQIAHDLSASFKRAEGQREAPYWHELASDAWERKDTLRQVALLRGNATLTARQDHEAWRQARVADGWTWGAERDLRTKQNPLLVPWEELPFTHRARSTAGFQVVRILLGQR